MHQDSPARFDCHQRAATHGVDGRLVACEVFEKRDLGEAGAGECGLPFCQERADLGPGAVGTHHHIGGHARPVRHGDSLAMPVSGDGRHLTAPADRSLRKRLDQHLSQLAPVDFRTGFAVATRIVEQNVSVPTRDSFGVLAGANQAGERVEQVRVSQSLLAGLLVNVEQASLSPRVRGRLSLIHCRGYVVDLQDTSKCEATEPCTNDRDLVFHHSAPLVTSVQRRRRLSPMPDRLSGIAYKEPLGDRTREHDRRVFDTR